MSRREFRGRSAAEAAIHACEELGVSRADLRYEVLSERGEGLERVVVIAVDIEAGAAPSGEGRAATADEERQREWHRDREPHRGDEERGGGRGRRGGGGAGRHRESRPHGGEGRPPRMARGRDDDRHRRGPREAEGDGIEALLNLDAPGAVKAPPRPALEGDGGALAVQARTVLTDLTRHMGLSLEIVRVGESDEELEFDLRGADETRVVGRKGEGILALQFLVNRMMSREAEEGKRVVIDAGGYRQRRRDALADLARRLAARALEERKVVRLSPMSAHDRRIFHITLEEVAGVTTRSEGAGLFRKLLIIPEENEQE